MKKFRVLAGDPGTKNFALSVIEYNEGKLTVVGTKMVAHPFRDLSSRAAAADLWKFTREIKRIIDQYKIDALYFERFQVRGSNATAIEGINVMLGSVLMLAFRLKLLARLITASTWKNNFNRNNEAQTKLDELYKEFKLTSKFSPKAIHEFDASLIGVYCIYDTLVQSRKPFVGFDAHAFFEHFISAPTLALNCK